MAQDGGSAAPRGEVIALLGAGSTMGFAMARNMLKAGLRVRAWNRSAEKAQPLAQDGAEIGESPAEAAQGASLIVTMLSNADAVIETIEPVLRDGDSGVAWVQMSTIGEQGTERCIELAREHDVAFLDAPVLGTKGPAEQGKLVILASGPHELRERVQPMFDAVGQKTMWVDDAPGASTRLKLVANSWVVTVTEGAAETIALAEGLGLDPSLLFDALDGGALDLPYLRTKGNAMIERNFEPMFRLELAAKDARLVAESGERHHLNLPMLSAIAERMTEGAEAHGDKDMAATYLTSAPRSG
ncbi:MAG: NAD(P)-dependent oxidoreductase [Solirubrobacteraceae bacterium]